MSVDEIRKLLRAVPFTPFSVHLADGTTLLVPHSDYAAITPNGAVPCVFHMNERTDRVVMNQITKVGTLTEAEFPG